MHHLDVKRHVYDLETESFHLHNNLISIKLFVQDIIKPLENPLFMNKKSSEFKEINDQSKTN